MRGRRATPFNPRTALISSPSVLLPLDDQLAAAEATNARLRQALKEAEARALRTEVKQSCPLDWARSGEGIYLTSTTPAHMHPTLSSIYPL